MIADRCDRERWERYFEPCPPHAHTHTQNFCCPEGVGRNDQIIVSALGHPKGVGGEELTSNFLHGAGMSFTAMSQ